MLMLNDAYTRLRDEETFIDPTDTSIRWYWHTVSPGCQIMGATRRGDLMPMLFRAFHRVLKTPQTKPRFFREVIQED